MYLQQNLKIYLQLFLLFDNKLIHCNFTEYLKNDFLFCILQLAKTFTGQEWYMNLHIIDKFFWTEYHYLDQTEIFCHRCASILGQLSCCFITYPAMDTTSPRVHPQSVLKSKVLWKHLTMYIYLIYKHIFGKFPKQFFSLNHISKNWKINISSIKSIYIIILIQN